MTDQYDYDRRTEDCHGEQIPPTWEEVKSEGHSHSPTALMLRKSHKFVGSYQHEDNWEYIGRYVIVEQQLFYTDPDDMCEPMSLKMRLWVKPMGVVEPDQIKQALRDSFTMNGCHHAWDCCGCRGFYASLVEYNDITDEWLVTQSSSRNY